MLCARRYGAQVSRGEECEDFGKVTLHSDYVWGHAVDLDRIRPGDVLQFRNHVVKVHTETDAGWEERTYTQPHHTAVVVAVEGDGSVIVVEQKVKPDPKKVTRNVIARLAQGTETRSGTAGAEWCPAQCKHHYYRHRCRQGVSASTEIEGGVAFPAGISDLPVPQGRCSHAISQARADRSVDRGQSAQPRKIGGRLTPIFLSNPGFAREIICVHEGVVAGESLGRGPQIGAARAAAWPVPTLPQHAGVGDRSARRPGAKAGFIGLPGS